MEKIHDAKPGPNARDKAVEDQSLYDSPQLPAKLTVLIAKYFILHSQHTVIEVVYAASLTAAPHDTPAWVPIFYESLSCKISIDSLSFDSMQSRFEVSYPSIFP